MPAARLETMQLDMLSLAELFSSSRKHLAVMPVHASAGDKLCLPEQDLSEPFLGGFKSLRTG